MIQKFRIGNLNCLCALGSRDRISYVLYPLDDLERWLVTASAQFEMSIVAITGMDWDDDLTPWPAPGVPAGSADFAGNATIFLGELQNRVIPACEKTLGVVSPVRNLVGVSLSGLFAMWQWMLCDTFDNIAIMSGSFWYQKFPKWVADNCPVTKPGTCFMLLGRQEPHTPVPGFRPVGQNTEKIVDILQRHHILTEFQWVPGNHYQHQFERLNLCFDFLKSH